MEQEKNNKNQDNENDSGDDEKLRDVLVTQYDELSEYWRHFNSIIWAIPSVAVAIMTGIIVGAFQNGIVGWPRFAALTIGSIFLFALACVIPYWIVISIIC